MTVVPHSLRLGFKLIKLRRIKVQVCLNIQESFSLQSTWYVNLTPAIGRSCFETWGCVTIG